MEGQSSSMHSNQQSRDRAAVLDPNECVVTGDSHTIVVFGLLVFGINNAQLLVRLLSNNGNLVVILHCHGAVISVYDPTNPLWRPNPKYILCYETTSDRIQSYLSTLKGPFQFIVAFDLKTDIWSDELNTIIKYLGKNVSENRNNQLLMIAMDIEHDKNKTFEEKIAELKDFFDDFISADFKIKGMHQIKKSGRLSKMPELLSELAAIQSITGNV